MSFPSEHRVQPSLASCPKSAVSKPSASQISTVPTTTAFSTNTTTITTPSPLTTTASPPTLSMLFYPYSPTPSPCLPSSSRSQPAQSTLSSQSLNSKDNSKDNHLAPSKHTPTLSKYFSSIKGFIPDNIKKIDNPDDSDSEETTSKNNIIQISSFPLITHGQSVSATLMTIPSSHYGKLIQIKGNQLIFWCRKMFENVSAYKFKEPERLGKIQFAVQSKEVVIQSAYDWVLLEGIFDCFAKRPARIYSKFFGILRVMLNDKIETTIEFKYKVNKKKNEQGKWITEKTKMLYAHIHDEDLISFLVEDLKFTKYIYSDNRGLSYHDLINIMDKFKEKFKDIYTDSNERKYTDISLAQRQLQILMGKLESMEIFDRFLAYFNAILFGSEASRNNLSYVTGLMVLDLISKGYLTYEQAFKSPDSNVTFQKLIFRMN